MADHHAKDARQAKRLQSFDDDDIVRYSMGLDIPIVGIVRNRDEYKEMREMSLILGYTLGLRRKSKEALEAPADEEALRMDAPVAEGEVPAPAVSPMPATAPANAEGNETTA